MEHMGYEVVVSKRAKEHLRDIKDYITIELNAPQAARSVLDDLEEALASLDMFPERIPFSKIKELRLRGVHCMVVRKYLIYFEIDEAARRVTVAAVLYGKRDQAAQMETIIEN